MAYALRGGIAADFEAIFGSIAGEIEKSFAAVHSLCSEKPVSLEPIRFRVVLKPMSPPSKTTKIIYSHSRGSDESRPTRLSAAPVLFKMTTSKKTPTKVDPMKSPNDSFAAPHRKFRIPNGRSGLRRMATKRSASFFPTREAYFFTEF